MTKKPKKPVKDKLDEYITPNAGWVSRIIDNDPRMHHAEHIRFMNNFTPHPDPASAWLFHEPAVELQGNKYD